LIEDLPEAEHEAKITAFLRKLTADAREAMSFIDNANNKQFSFPSQRETLQTIHLTTSHLRRWQV
jgi:hypothetical protein